MADKKAEAPPPAADAAGAQAAPKKGSKKKLIMIGTECFLKSIVPLDQIIEKVNSEGWVAEVNRFDCQMREYLPLETKKFITIDDFEGNE